MFPVFLFITTLEKTHCAFQSLALLHRQEEGAGLSAQSTKCTQIMPAAQTSTLTISHANNMLQTLWREQSLLCPWEAIKVNLFMAS